jgi:hypothetical protein
MAGLAPLFRAIFLCLSLCDLVIGTTALVLKYKDIEIHVYLLGNVSVVNTTNATPAIGILLLIRAASVFAMACMKTNGNLWTAAFLDACRLISTLVASHVSALILYEIHTGSYHRWNSTFVPYWCIVTMAVIQAIAFWTKVHRNKMACEKADALRLQNRFNPNKYE